MTTAQDDALHNFVCHVAERSVRRTAAQQLFSTMDEPQVDERQARELQSFMEMENQKAVIQAAISKLTETCFDKCVQTPGSKLDSSQANCIANCAGRYLDSSVFVVNRMMAKRQGQQ